MARLIAWFLKSVISGLIIGSVLWFIFSLFGGDTPYFPLVRLCIVAMLLVDILWSIGKWLHDKSQY